MGDIAKVRTGFPFESNAFSDDGEWLVITNGNVLAESSEVVSCYGNRINPSQSLIDQFGLKRGDILVTMDGDVGRSAKVADNRMILAQRVARMTALSNTEFLYQWLNSGSFYKAMINLSHGGTIKHISLDEISSYRGEVPSSKDEQEVIGSFFSHLDNLITLHQREVDVARPSWTETSSQGRYPDSLIPG